MKQLMTTTAPKERSLCVWQSNFMASHSGTGSIRMEEIQDMMDLSLIVCRQFVSTNLWRSSISSWSDNPAQFLGNGEAPFWDGPNELTSISMGTRYLAMAIVNKKQGIPIPFE
ncbi:uncharacterized protein LOC122046223 isoform X8 [Zingiber officinale]|uniref:uncharacterized protein LOC122046223 isoform X8 n=1 Tax=Zingiber officinale TaxID=94328 RepID=UPI001C4B2AEF|nr:uncharacterized protein LOC122046223 isoform X8 [Zingiber officinale]XP_042462757.1 uncharacterized protein LOC122046223 isoform X8 [Zingiber officinale]XP_042462758.1 uncharacterized protein LOC122046223 isoform X8 [Zingiber officinale]XP_042462759.1 uncharacterized protein LOC122046223 isoform X8 [Zingiber officinale]XP_042462760.1 uncharacterized protein LOC122046223 isoform X8 [Zingiber officinale]XP_042462761.1 uncharacterized protein LOC122046223 isoform X8 [Zingiber officinale]XP_04